MADIIVTDVTPRVQYTAGAGSPTVFTYAFPIFANTDLNVYKTPVGQVANDVVDILVYNVDYTVTNSVPPTVGGTITLTVGATSGDVITIVRNQPDNRLNNYIAGGLFEATDVNTDFDRTVFMAQQNKMYDQVLGLHYNVSAQPVAPLDTVLPVLGANETWVKNNANTAIIAVDITGGLGVVNSVTGTANQITANPTQGDVVLSIPATFIAPGTIRAVTSVSAPAYLLTGSGSGTISILPQAAAGTYNFNMPITAGTSGYLLTSAGGGASVMTWTDPTTIGAVTSVSGTANRISVSPTTGAVIVDISATYVGQTSITTLGTITAGTWNASAIGTIYGGTGITSYTLGDTLYASGANVLAKLSGNITSGIQYLAQTGTGAVSAAPAWTTISGGDITGAALTKTDDTNVTLTLGGSPSTALLRAASLTLGWTGQLSLTRGGTNASLTADNGGVVYSTASALAILASTATAGKVLQSGSSAAPSWSTPTYPSASGTAGKILRSDGTNNVYSTSTFADTYAASTILYSNGANTVTGLATANKAVLTTGATGVPVLTALATDGQLIIGSTAGVPAAATLTAGSGVTITNAGNSITIAATGSGGTVTSVSGTANRITSTGGTTPVIDISASYVGQSSITTLGTITTGVWNGSVVALAYGGTNANLTASNGGIFYSTATAGAILSGTATANQVLLSGSSAAPAWSTATYPATTTVSQLLYSSSANVIAGLATANSAVLVTGSTGVPVMSSTMTNGQLIIGSTGATPTAATLTAGSNITITNSAGGISIAAAAGASGELVLLASNTSSSSSISEFNALFSSSYDMYMFEFWKVLPATDGVVFQAQVGTGGTPTYITANYQWSVFGGEGSGGYQNSSNTSDSLISVSAPAARTGALVHNVGGISGFLYLYGPNASSQITQGTGMIGFIGSTGNFINEFVTFYQPAATITAIKFLFSSGNIASGVIRLYGIKNT